MRRRTHTAARGVEIRAYKFEKFVSAFMENFLLPNSESILSFSIVRVSTQ